VRDRRHIEAAIAAQEGLRGVVPDEVVDAALTALRRQIADLDGVRARRRQITVVFADVSGFTALSERLDPEILAGLMNELWESLDGVVVGFGGRVDKHMGDAVMALFGADAVQEDDVERAVRAGLALHDALAAFRQSTGHPLAMRVGINTGQALVGSVGSATEQTAMGDTVNVASRLEHAAPVGSVLVSDATYRHVRGVFDVQALEPLEVRGKTERVQTYLVLREKPRAFRIASRGIEGVETPTVGRDAELDRLRSEFEAAALGTARSVVVVGDAGVGKSRLLFELEAWIELRSESVWLLQGRALRSRQGVALGLMRDVLAQRFGVLDSDTSAEVFDKLRLGFEGSLSAAEAAAVGQWLGFDLGDVVGPLGVDGVSVTARAHLVRWLGSLTAEEPAVILLEDLHWADDESLGLLLELVARLPDARLLVVGLTRPELADRYPEWFGEPSMARIDLAPLPPEAIADLTRLVLQHADVVPDELVELIVARCDGNPFFAEELVKMLIDDGVIRTDAPDQSWSIDMARLAVSRVPATLTGVLQARLDHLGPFELTTLQCASIVGRVFWDSSVAALDDTATPEHVRASLDLARSRELVFRRHHSVFAGSEEHIFKHALLRDVTYETVLLTDRKRLHSRAASWLTAEAGDRLVEYLDTVANHHRLAGEPAAAAECFHRAARADLRRGLADSARRSVQKAIEQWTLAGASVPSDASVVLSDSLRRLGNFDAAEQALVGASAAATTDGERADVLQAARRVAGDRGDPRLERALLDEAAGVDSVLWPDAAAHVAEGLAWWELRFGDIELARRHAEEARAISERTTDVAGTAAAHGVIAAIAESAGHLDEADQHVRICLELARAIGDIHGEATARGRMGVIAHLRADARGSREDYITAIAHYDAAARLYRQLGDRMMVGVAVSNIAQARLRLGDLPGSRTAGREAMTDLAGLGAVDALLFCLLVEADVCLTDGDTARGLALLGIVRAHPVATHLDLQEIERILSRTALDPIEIKRGMASKTGLDLDEVVADLVTESAATAGFGSAAGPDIDET
jgi:class 3 adenylate cyclase/tetratricopeptide (TPR) repeat protein